MKKVIKNETLTYSVYESYVNSMRKNYVNLNVTVCGKSVLGKRIYSLVLGQGQKNVVYVGGTHGLEWMTSLVLLEFCENLLIQKNAEGSICGYDVNELLNSVKLIIIPELNPDGIEIAIRGASACGKYKKENFDACGGDFSGWSANARGVDINHNFNADWYTLRDFERASGINQPSPRRFGGFFPESEPETKAITRLCRSIPVDLLIAFHSQGEEIYYEYGKNTPEKSYTMAQVFSAVSNYTLVKNSGHAASGGLKDWFIEEFKKPAFTIELGEGENPLPLNQFREIYQSAEALMVMGMVL